MSPLAASWRNFLLLSLLLAGLAFGIRNVTGNPAKAVRKRTPPGGATEP